MSTDLLVTKTIAIHAPAAQVWQVLTDSESIKEWLSDTGTLQIRTDWQVGGPFVYFGTWHGVRYQTKGTLLQLEPEKVLQYNHWSRISRLPDRPENYAVVEFRLAPEENHTRLVLTHSNLVGEAAVQHANLYWNATLQKVKRLAETR